jgi:hypothetical protein
MKLILLTAAALIASPVLAQTTSNNAGLGTAQSGDSSGTQTTPPTATPTDPNMSTPASNQSATPMTTQGGNTGGMTAGDQGGMSSTGATASGGSYPACSRTVTDHCVERSNARGERLHSTPRKRTRR